VFVHGAAEDGRVWRPQLAAPGDELTVVAWDEPGAGSTSNVPRTAASQATRKASRHASRRSDSPRPKSPASPGAVPSCRSSPPLSRGGRDPDRRRHVSWFTDRCPRRRHLPGARGPSDARRARGGVRPHPAALFAADPPAEFVLLPEKTAAAVPQEASGHSCSRWARPNARPAVPHRCAHPAALG
jgi:hypothetical protein